MKTKFGLVLLPAVLTFLLAATLAPAACAERLDDPLGQRPVCVPAPAGIVGWWPGDGNASDIAGGNNGTLVGGVSFMAGKVDKAFSFDGSSGEVIVPHVPTLNFTATDSFSIDAWLKPSSQGFGTQHVAVNLTYACTPEAIILLVLTDGTIDFSLRDSNGTTADAISPGSILDDQWHHVAGVRDLANRRVILYLDAAPVVTVTDTMTGTFTNPNGQNRIGSIPVVCGGTKYFWLGQIDDVEVFRAALSPTDVASIFNAQSAGKCRTCVQPPANMVAWLTAEGSGFDRTGRGNNGVLENGTTFAPGKVGQAFKFDGVDDYVRIDGTSGDFNFQASDFTIDAWVNFTAQDTITRANPVFFATGYVITGSFPSVWLYADTAGDAVFRIRDDAGTTLYLIDSVSIMDGLWHHVAGVRQGITATLYVDGIKHKEQSDPAFGTITVPCAFATSGGINPTATCAEPANDRFLFGLLDELEVYHRALSDAEILAIADAGSAGKCRLPTAVTLSSLEASAAADNQPWLLAGAAALLGGVLVAGVVFVRRRL